MRIKINGGDRKPNKTCLLGIYVPKLIKLLFMYLTWTNSGKKIITLSRLYLGIIS